MTKRPSVNYLFYGIAAIVFLSIRCFANQFDAEYNQLYDKQKKQWESESEERYFNQRDKNKSLQLQWPDSPTVNARPTGNRFFVHTIQLTGVTQVPKYKQREWLNAMEGRKLGISDMNQFIDTINRWYSSHGYITTRAFLEQGQSIASGTLSITVEEGSVQSIVDEQGRTPLAYTLALPFRGSILNLRDLEQGLEQLNRLSQNRMMVNLLPAQSGYGTQVQIVNKNRSMLTVKNNASISYSYETSAPMNVFPNQLMLRSDNFLRINDQWVTTYSQNHMSSTNQAFSLYSFVSIPYGYWLVDYTYSLFNYNQMIQLGVFTINYHGETEQNAVRLARTIQRGQGFKTNAQLRLSMLNQVQNQEALPLTVSSYKKTIGQIGLHHQWYGRINGWLDGQYHQGLSWFDSDKDLENPGPTEPRFMFNKVTVSTQINTAIPFIWPLSYQLKTQHQWSAYPLYASDRIALGGRYSVRGFNGGLSGDYGYYAQHEWRSPVQLPGWHWLKKLKSSLVFGLDHGSVFSIGGQRANNGFGEGSLVGGAVGVRFQAARVYCDVIVTKPIQWSANIQPDNEVIYATVRLDWF